MSDLLKRLAFRAFELNGAALTDKARFPDATGSLLLEAADTIDRLTKENERSAEIAEKVLQLLELVGYRLTPEGLAIAARENRSPSIIR